jgi:hypothetical protein
MEEKKMATKETKKERAKEDNGKEEDGNALLPKWGAIY